MAQLHITDAEAARDFRAVLARVRKGDEVIIDEGRHPVAVIRPLRASGRPISECIAAAKASGSTVTLDEGFAADVEAGIRSNQQPWNPPSWD